VRCRTSEHPRPQGSPGKPKATAGHSQLAETYRYVADRLRHRLRNSMLSAHAQARKLRSLVPVEATAEVQNAVARLNDSLIAMGRAVEATDIDPDYFQARRVVLADWLRKMNQRYAVEYSSVILRIDGLIDQGAAVFASDYLLDIIFWNLWMNAHQEIGENCEISVDLRRTGRLLALRISDNGSGFNRERKDVLFQEFFSTKSQTRGRGLLEMQDAVERLHGTIGLYEVSADEYRIKICLPLEGT